MFQCPICNTEDIEEKTTHCPTCGWDLTPYPLTFELPESFQKKEQARLVWAKEMWAKISEEEKRNLRQIRQFSLEEAQINLEPEKLQMLEQNSVQVHEFSRVFVNVSFKDGKWVSGGYGDEVGKSNHPIPDPIKTAVEGGDFRIYDSYPPKENDYALIGREIDKYSVLAVATTVQDYHNRYAVAYRYFWLEKTAFQDIDGVGTLLIWWLIEGKPKFDFQWNPNNSTLNYITRYYSREETYKYFQQYQPHVQNIINNINYYPFVFQKKYAKSRNGLHYLALYLNKQYSTPIAWAWNVRWLDKPEKFSLISYAD